MKTNLPKDDKFMRLKQVIAKTAIQKSKIYNLISKNQFPKPRKIGSMSRWLESEIHAWMQSNV